MSKIWAWCHNLLPGEHVPVTNYPFSKESFPVVASELPLMQLHYFSLCPIASHQRGEVSTSP